jgi:hypothetical protein
MRSLNFGVLAVVACVSLGGCSSDQMSRGVYDGLRRREELQPAPGADRKELPSYDQYQRTRQRSAGDL